MNKLVLAIILVLGASSVAVAAEGAAHYDFVNLAWRLVNFAIFAAILWWAGGKKLIAFMRKRHDGIVNSLDELKKMRQEAENNLASLEKSIVNLEEERKSILEEAKTQAELIKNSIIAQAEERGREIIAQAELTAENDARIMLENLRSQVADELVSSTQNYLIQHLDDKTHMRLINNALQKVVF